VPAEGVVPLQTTWIVTGHIGGETDGAADDVELDDDSEELDEVEVVVRSVEELLESLLLESLLDILELLELSVEVVEEDVTEQAPDPVGLLSKV
jgi:pseudouridine-5'-phosphate glycosidase